MFSLCDYGLITQEDAQVASHNSYQALAIGGTLYDLTPSESGFVGGHSWVHRQNFPQNFVFSNGVSTWQCIPFDWHYFEYLATTLGATDLSFALGDAKGKHGLDAQVHIVCQGGVYDFGTRRWIRTTS